MNFWHFVFEFTLLWSHYFWESEREGELAETWIYILAKFDPITHKNGVFNFDIFSLS